MYFGWGKTWHLADLKCEFCAFVLTAFQVLILRYTLPIFSPQKRKTEWHFPPFHSSNWQQFTSVVTFFSLASNKYFTEYVLWTSDGQVPQQSGETSKTLDTIRSFRGHPSFFVAKIGQKYSKNRPLSWGFGTSAPVWGQKRQKIWKRRLKEILLLIGEKIKKGEGGEGKKWKKEER